MTTLVRDWQPRRIISDHWLLTKLIRELKATQNGRWSWDVANFDVCE